MQNFDNLREMDQLLEKYKLPQLAQIKQIIWIALLIQKNGTMAQCT